MAHGDHGHGGGAGDHGHGHSHGGHSHGGHSHGGHSHGGHSHGDHSHGDHSHGGHSHGDHPHHDHAHGSPADVPRIHHAKSPTRVRVAVVTASDTRTEETDTSGRYLRETLADRGQQVVHSTLVPDTPEQVRAAIAAAQAAGAEVVIVTGGTGISRRDATFEAVDVLLHKRLPGFGELFRMLSFQEIGSAAMLSRATAGVTAEGTILFAVPGSTGACRTALEKLILPELGHLVREAGK